MNILYLTNSFPNEESAYDGIFNFRRVEQLIKKGIKVEVISYNNILQKKKISFKKRYNLKAIGFDIDLDVNVINYINLPIFKNFLLYAIKNIFINKQFDLIHSHFIWNGYLCSMLKKKFGIPYILTVHGSDIHTEPFINEKKWKIAVQSIENAEKMIFVSKYLLDKAKEFGYEKQDYEIIPNGIDPLLFRVIPEIENKFKFKKDNEKIVGFVGGLDPVKRVEIFPEMFFIITKKLVNVKFLIIGDGALRKKMEEGFEKYGISDKVMMTGNVHPDDIPYYMNNMDILLLPSEKEGFPCVIMEAFSCGLYVVTSNNGGIPEAVGDCGIIVDDGDDFILRFSDAISKALSRIVDKNKLLERASLYSWEKIVESEINVYIEITKRIESENARFDQ
jgi:glycosyltransferase involved in cell wall biosynthesis